jgi:hypothetical protein
MAEDPHLLGILGMMEAWAAQVEAEMGAEATDGPETPRHRKLGNLLARLVATIDQFRSGTRTSKSCPG